MHTTVDTQVVAVVKPVQLVQVAETVALLHRSCNTLEHTRDDTMTDGPTVVVPRVPRVPRYNRSVDTLGNMLVGNQQDTVVVHVQR